MGHSSKKKKRGGGSRKGKGKASSKDHQSHADDDPDLLSEEITALSAIFQDDIKLVSDSSVIQFIINLRPYFTDMDSDDSDISALLSVRCLPGYPFKCPKLRIIPERGLSPDDADKLLSLLVDQANINSREGRVMVFNLVEVAQEFLSEISPVLKPADHVRGLGLDKNERLHDDLPIVCDHNYSSSGPFTYDLVDLFSDLCGDVGSWEWSIGTNTVHPSLGQLSRNQVKSRDDNSPTLAKSLSAGYGDPQNHPFRIPKPVPMVDIKGGSVSQPVSKLDVVKEGTEDGSKSISPATSDLSLREQSLEKGSSGDMHGDSMEKVLVFGEKTTESDDSDLEGHSLDTFSIVSSVDQEKSRSVEQDLVMVHLLHLACSSKGPLENNLAEIASELHKLGIISNKVRDLATMPTLDFNKAFDDAFSRYMVSSPITQFWKANADSGGEKASSRQTSRYLNDFEEISSLGHGGFGHVVLCKNKLDGRQYAVKKIRLKDKNLPVNDKILREVATLSRLQHQHVVRYYQAWFETEVGGYAETTWGSLTPGSSSCSYKGDTTMNLIGPDNKLESTYLYIQMEYCPRTLRKIFESYSGFDKEFTWHLFRQIVEGLAHIHGQGIIHRDLTPSNVFFDARNDVKIGDFGLAKFLKLEQLDHDPSFQNETGRTSMDGTGQVGTYFYTAPEIEHGWPQVNEKVDMYSLGVVFFELWHPFSTGMERNIVLSDLKQKGVLPPTWVAKFPEQSSLVKLLMSQSPSDRPSAKELLQHFLPPRMEDEWLTDILRTIQTSEDTYVYEQVVSAIFDEERIFVKANRQHGGREKIIRDKHSFVQFSESDTELHDYAVDVAREVFRQHGAKRLEITQMHIVDEYHHLNRKAVKVLTPGGNMLELCYELRLPFINWAIENQKVSFKRYEISWVYRRAIGHSTPNRFLQGDFDIIGGAHALTEAETIKVASDIVTQCFHSDACKIRLNHGHVLDAIWSWVGIEHDLRQSVAKLLSLMASSCPQSSDRKTRWVLIRRQLLQDLHLSEAVVNRLQTVDLRFCGPADKALARLRGALPSDKPTRKALEDLSDLLRYMRIWRIEKHVTIDALMQPTESYYREIFFQIYLVNDCNPSSLSEGTLFAVGGRYDYLLHRMWLHEHKSSPPGAVGVSLALEKILRHSSVEFRPFRNEPGNKVLVCARGGGGLLEERMELVAELWQANIKAELVARSDPSLTEQYEYANEHDVKCLVIITESGLSHTGSVKVRHLELKKEKEIERQALVKFLTDAISTQFRNLTIWN